MCVGIQFSPDLQQQLQLDRVSIADGQYWRLWTAHLVHWDWGHLFWDLIVFVLLGLIGIHRQPRGCWICIGLAAISVSTVVLLWSPEVRTYRGLSGIDTALFTWLVLVLGKDLCNSGRWGGLAWMVLATCMLAVKTGYEFLTGDTLFVERSAGVFIPLPLAHIAGSIAACVTWSVWLLVPILRADGMNVGSCDSTSDWWKVVRRNGLRRTEFRIGDR
jgi:rhomboid family GlyGly-CTERM serine protease